MRMIVVTAFLILLPAPIWAEPAIKWPKGVDLFALAALAPKSGSNVKGTVEFGRRDNSLVIQARVDGLSGTHGIHIHEKGDCSSHDAESAGDHFNPTGGRHKGPREKGRHAGDLGNLVANEDGVATLEATFPPPAESFDWKSIIGKAVVIHERADDLRTQPAGDSGKRIACGTIYAHHFDVDLPNTKALPIPDQNVQRKAD